METYLFEGATRTLPEIHAMVPGYTRETLRKYLPECPTKVSLAIAREGAMRKAQRTGAKAMGRFMGRAKGRVS